MRRRFLTFPDANPDANTCDPNSDYDLPDKTRSGRRRHNAYSHRNWLCQHHGDPSGPDRRGHCVREQHTVTAAIPAAQLATGALLPIIALNGSSTSGSGAKVDLEVDSPSPTTTQLVPSNLPAGSAASSIVVTGTGFVSSTVINVGGSPHPTIYTSPTEVNVVPSAADLTAAGSLALTAVNPSPGGGSSASSAFAVNPLNPAPGAIAVAPGSVLAGTATPTTITVTGSNFVSTSTAETGGNPRPTTVAAPLN